MLGLEPLAEQPEPGLPLFPRWYALLVEPNREEHSARMLIDLNVICYLPMFVVQVAVGYGGRRRAMRPVMPGLMFMPKEYCDVPRRDEIFELAHIRGFLRTSDNLPGVLTKDEIERIREIEALLNLPPPPPPTLPLTKAELAAKFQVDHEVRFKNPLYAAFWGTGLIRGIVGGSRITITVKKLFGCPQEVHVPASELEAI
jgi:Transcription termination factor nusG